MERTPTLCTLRLEARAVATLLLLLLPAVESTAKPAPPTSADWPSQRGDLGRRGHSGLVLDAHRLTEDWRWTSAEPPKPAWPGPARWDAFAGLAGLKAMRNYDPVFHVTAVGDSVFFGSSTDDAVRCLDAETGEERWIFRTGGPVRVAPTVDGKFLYFGSDDGSAYCIRRENGEQVWRFDPKEAEPRVLSNGRIISAWPIRTGVHVLDGIAYFGASMLPWRSSFLCAVSAKTGKITGGSGRRATYVQDLGTGWTLEGALLLSPENVVIPQGRIAPLIFDRTTGKPNGTLSGGGGSFCLLTEDDQIYHGPGNKDGWITASTAGSRERLASYARGNAIVVDGDVAFMLSDRSLAAMNRKTQTLLWSRTVDTPYEVVLIGDILFCGGDGKVEARNSDDGALVWRAEVDGRVWGMAAANGRLLISTDLGVVSSFSEQGEAQAAPAELTTSAESAELEKPPKIARTQKPSALLDRWVFQDDQRTEVPIADGDPRTRTLFENSGKGRDVHPLGRAPVVQVGGMHALVWDGKQGDIEVSSDLSEVRRPKRKMSAEAWVRIDEPKTWGGLISIAQDNGDYERGWMLGFRDRHFAFALASERGSGRLNWIRSDASFQLGSWHHVVGTYDGKMIRLFVDGEEVATSDAEKGDIAYPDEAYYHLGAYRDADEYFRAKGMIAELALYKDTLSPREIAKNYALRASLVPPPVMIEGDTPNEGSLGPEIALPVAPSIRFTAPNEATVEWETKEARASLIEMRSPGQDPVIVEIAGSRTKHSSRLTNLRDQTVYTCAVLLDKEEGGPKSEAFEIDTHFDLFRDRGAWPDPPRNPESTAITDWWRDGSPVKDGVAVVLGFTGSKEDAQWIASLAAEMRRLIVVSTQPNIADQRRILAAAGPYGARISCVEASARGPVGLPNRIANLLVGNPRDPKGVKSLLDRGAINITRPDGGIAILPRSWTDDADESTTPPPRFDGFSDWSRGPGAASRWLGARRDPVPGAADWSHMYGLPDNSAYSGESLGGATGTDELELMWIGRPGPRYQTDRQNRKPAPLATAGRLFLQGLNRLLAIDAYNGSLLWDVGLPKLERFNIPRSSSNWCADRNYLYAAMGDRLHLIDAATGAAKVEHPVHVPTALQQRAPEATWEWGYVAQRNDLCFGSAVRSGGQFTEWWGGEHWFDDKGGENAKKVCSDALFAISKQDGAVRWTRTVGRIIEPTIAISDGRMVFAECRDPAALAIESARIGKELWQDLWLVCLDAQTGELLWERTAKPLPGDTAFYLAIGEGTIIMVSSGLREVPAAELPKKPAGQGGQTPNEGEVPAPVFAGDYAIYAFDLANGKSTWRKKIDWEVDHHGKHLSRPAIASGRLILRPMVFELATGKTLTTAFPAGHQCGSYACSKHAIFLRAGDMTVWDPKTNEASKWARLRPDCWISTIPAAGMLLSPEGGGGCSCGSWIQASMGFAPISKDSGR